MGGTHRRWFVLLLVVVAASAAVLGYFVLGVQRPQPSIKYPATYHSPISISGEADFTKPGAGSGCECVRSGSGRELDAYVISDWIVNSTNSEGITISGARAHFVIARVELQGASYYPAIRLDDVENGIVEGCHIVGWSFGAYVTRSANLEFINNTVTGNTNGIQLEASNNNRLVGNRFDQNGQLGIFLRGSYNVLENNSASRNEWGGINMDGTAGSAYQNQLEGNIVSENAVFGIGVWRATNNVLKSNVVSHNKGVGIMFTDHSAKNLIEANVVSNNTGTGIALTDGSSENTIRGNTAKGNGDGVNDFDLYDGGSDNMWQSNTYDTKNLGSID